MILLVKGLNNRLTKCFVPYTHFDHEKFNGCSQKEKHRHKFIHAKTLTPFIKHHKFEAFIITAPNSIDEYQPPWNIFYVGL
jgi:hypothetical protein